MQSCAYSCKFWLYFCSVWLSKCIWVKYSYIWNCIYVVVQIYELKRNFWVQDFSGCDFIAVCFKFPWKKFYFITRQVEWPRLLFENILIRIFSLHPWVTLNFKIDLMNTFLSIKTNVTKELVFFVKKIKNLRSVRWNSFPVLHIYWKSKKVKIKCDQRLHYSIRIRNTCS